MRSKMTYFLSEILVMQPNSGVNWVSKNQANQTTKPFDLMRSEIENNKFNNTQK